MLVVAVDSMAAAGSLVMVVVVDVWAARPVDFRGR
jgi:hypothetical protein